jgi:hypothetical protein
MRPIDFPEANRTIGCRPSARDYGADTDELVEPIRAYVSDDGVVTELWSPTWRERLSVLLFGRVWVDLLTGNGRPQPIALRGCKTVFTQETP